MGSGPSNAEPRVLQAMVAAPLSASDPLYATLLDAVATLTQSVFQAPDSHCAVAVPGASRSGLEAVINSVVAPGDRVIVGVYGHFGELLCTLAQRHGAVVARVDADWGEPVDPEAMAGAIRKHPPKLAAIVHADTSTGILQPIDLIGAACRDTGALLLVDAVLSIGGCDVNVGAFNADAAVGGLQKCLGGPPGLAPVTYSDRLGASMAVRHSEPHSAYLDLKRLSTASPERPTHLLFAAHEALRMVMDEGLNVRWRRHETASRMLRAGLMAMGLDRFGDPHHSVPMITLVKVPDGIDEAGVRQQLLDEHGIEIMAAFGPLRGRVWRIGTMGTNARLSSVLAVLSALEAVLASRHLPLDRGAAVDAATKISRQPRA